MLIRAIACREIRIGDARARAAAQRQCCCRFDATLLPRPALISLFDACYAL